MFQCLVGLVILSLPGTMCGPTLDLVTDFFDKGLVVLDIGAMDTSDFLVLKDSIGLGFGNLVCKFVELLKVLQRQGNGGVSIPSWVVAIILVVVVFQG